MTKVSLVEKVRLVSSKGMIAILVLIAVGILSVLLVRSDSPMWAVAIVSMLFLLRFPELAIVYLTLNELLFGLLEIQPKFTSVPATLPLIASLFSLLYLLTRRSFEGLRLLTANGFRPKRFYIVMSVFAFWAYILLSAVRSSNFTVTLFSYPIFFLVCYLWLRQASSMDIVPWLFVASATYMTIAGFVQLAVEGMGPQGVSSFFSNHVTPSLYTWFGLPFTWYLAQEYHDSFRRSLLYSLSILFLVRILIGLSLGVLLVAAIGLALLAWKDRRIALPLSVACLIVLLVIPVVLGVFGERLNDFLSFEPSRFFRAISGRQLPLEAAWNIFRAHPIWGLGFGRMRVVWASFVFSVNLDFSNTGWENPAHSSFLNVAADLGIVGLFMYTLLLLFAVGSFVTAYRLASRYRKSHLARLSFAYLIVMFGLLLHAIIDNTGWLDKAFYLLLACAVWLPDQARSSPEVIPVSESHMAGVRKV